MAKVFLAQPCKGAKVETLAILGPRLDCFGRLGLKVRCSIAAEVPGPQRTLNSHHPKVPLLPPVGLRHGRLQMGTALRCFQLQALAREDLIRSRPVCSRFPDRRRTMQALQCCRY